MIEPEYTKNQIKRAKKIAQVLFGNRLNTTGFRFLTEWGLKTNTGIINTILRIAFDPEEEV